MIAVNAIESSEATKDILPQEIRGAQNGDSSFDKILETEEKKRIILAFPWSSIQSAFDAVPLNFDFKIKTAKIENNFDKQEKPESNWGITPLPKKTETKNVPNTHSAAINPKTTSQILEDSQILSLKNYPVFGNCAAQVFLNKVEEELAKKMDMDILIEQIIGEVKLLKSKGKTELELSLKPESLGKLSLKIWVERGMVSIKIEASATTKDILTANLSELENSLKKANINIGSLEVGVSQSSKNEKEEFLKTYSINLEAPEHETIISINTKYLSKLLGYMIYSEI